MLCLRKYKSIILCIHASHFGSFFMLSYNDLNKVNMAYVCCAWLFLGNQKLFSTLRHCNTEVYGMTTIANFWCMVFMVGQIYIFLVSLLFGKCIKIYSNFVYLLLELQISALKEFLALIQYCLRQD